jgi:hypothetical protein
MVTWARWAAAVLYNGLGRYADALTAARQASEYRQLNIVSLWALPELVEEPRGRLRMAFGVVLFVA